jgi:hypothetical protein
MHASRVALIVASVVGMICTFLPWATVPFIGAIYGTRGDGWISLAACAGAGLISLVGDRRFALSLVAIVGSVLCGIAAGLVGLVDLVDLKNTLADNTLSSAVSVGPGLYVLIMASLAIIIVPPVLSRSDAPAPPRVWPPNN